MSHVFPPVLDRNYRVEDGRIRTRSLESHVVDHCNLTCAECCSLSPHLPRWFVDPAALARDLEQAKQVLAPRIFKLVGGEPLLHPEIVELVKIAKSSGIAPRVSITTNGLLLGRTPDRLWELVDAMTISVYPEPAVDRAGIDARAARFAVGLNWKEQTHFVRMNRARPCTDAAENAAVYDGCWIRERCHLIRDGLFYMCTRPPHFTALHRGSLDFTGDGLPLGAGVESLLAYLERKEPLLACAHCHGGSAPMAPHRLMARAELVRR